MSSSIADNNDDVISSLPDTVLCHILAFLPTKHAIATSVLSKRWTHLWRSVLVINFGEDVCRFHEEEKLISFNDFLNSVLLSRDSSSIKSFRLHVSYNNGDNNLDIIAFPSLVKWVEHVVKHNVESLDLCVYCNKGMPKLSNSVLTCRTLVVLKLNGFAVNGFSSVRLPSLKILSIGYSTLSSSRDFLLLLAGCPILEDLFVYKLKFYSNDSLNYQECENLDLRRLNKANMPRTYCHFPLKALHNVREMHIELNKVCHLLLLYE
ncbi:hypothetical protein TSUD_252580 [Trifolium subterraneum]|nr:hypothetical protein TSUD_252580 [Trifolium subterraneum]